MLSEPMRIRVDVPGAPYDVVVGEGVLADVGPRIAELRSPTAAAVVSDHEVARLYGQRAVASLSTAGIRTELLTVDPGERSKSWDAAGDLLSKLVGAGLGRRDLVVALGGGVVGDLAGFCASVYMRGIALVHLPTTLLAQVDAAIGGKTAVDLPAGKNLAGTFWQPLGVFSDTEALATLPEVEWLSGLGEVAKTALLAGGSTLDQIEADAQPLRARDPSAVLRAVSACAAFKASVVSADEREGGLRECLNLGHTLGHAIERAAGYGNVPHGVAVAEGIRFQAVLARDVVGLGEDDAQRQSALLDALGLPRIQVAPTVDALLSGMAVDKKAHAGIRFVLLKSPGDHVVVPIAGELLEQRVREWAEKRRAAAAARTSEGEGPRR